MIISLSGPSKSGKSVLVKQVVGPENLIGVSGASIDTVDDLWANVLSWMELPTEHTEMVSTKGTLEAGMSAGGEVGIPIVAKGKLDGFGKLIGERSSETARTFRQSGVVQVIKQIGGSDFVVFIDDFHYIPEGEQHAIGQQIKEASEKGVRMYTASVPHRADDVVRSNKELRGRVRAIDTDYWSDEELAQIGYLGFRALNVDLAPATLALLAAEAFGSPQLMQALCLNLCFEKRIVEALPEHRRVDLGRVELNNLLEQTSAMTDFSAVLRAMHSGPRQRGTERKIFEFVDGSQGDVYRCVLLAMKADPARLSLRYDELLQRTKEVTKADSPAGSSIILALQQMEYLARTIQEGLVIEWDDDVLDIVEPYFLFFLRNSPYVDRLGKE